MTDNRLLELAKQMLGEGDARTASPARIDALFAFTAGRALYRPTVHMRHQIYAWLLEQGLIEGDTDSCLLTPSGESLQAALRARANGEGL